jgi:hypothetical protein
MSVANEKYRCGIGPAARWFIFAGLPLAMWAVFFVIVGQHPALERAVGPTASGYLQAIVPGIIMVGGMAVYGYFPKRLVIPLGLVGWLIHVSLLGWFFWFGLVTR